MHIPYMRVAIYALTFLTYAYSGYGSNIISSLRDAIIAAEAVFGDVFKNAIHLAKKFQSVHEIFDAAVEENCVYNCPGGERPTRNKFHLPSKDGCGSLGIGISTEYLPAAEMATCCDDHDICYDTCNKDKELCDLDFKRCLYSYCDKYEKSTVGGEIMVKGCKSAAKMLFTATNTLGCKPYLNAQAKACYCPSTEGNSSRSSKSKSKDNNKRENRQDNKQKPPNYGWKNTDEL